VVCELWEGAFVSPPVKFPMSARATLRELSLYRLSFRSFAVFRLLSPLQARSPHIGNLLPVLTRSPERDVFFWLAILFGFCWVDKPRHREGLRSLAGLRDRCWVLGAALHSSASSMSRRSLRRTSFFFRKPYSRASTSPPPLIAQTLRIFGRRPLFNGPAARGEEFPFSPFSGWFISDDELSTLWSFLNSLRALRFLFFSSVFFFRSVSILFVRPGRSCARKGFRDRWTRNFPFARLFVH